MDKSRAESAPQPLRSIRESRAEGHETHQSATEANPHQSHHDERAPRPESVPVKVRCHRCGIESTQPELFCDEPRSFSTRVNKICPQCWAKRDGAGSRNRLWWIGILVTLGAVCAALWPENSVGWVMLNIAWLDIAIALALVPHEFAHATVAKAVGYRVFRIILGSGKVWWRGTIFGFPVEARVFPFIGFAMATPRDPRGVRWRHFAFILAGPMANVALLSLAYLALRDRTMPQLMEQRFWGWQLFAAGNLGVIVCNLVPYRVATALGAVSSDGLVLLNLLFRWKKETAQQLHASTYMIETQLSMENRDFEKAVGWVERGLAIYPEHVVLRQLRAHLHIRAGEFEQARAGLVSLLAKHPAASPTRLVFMNDLAYVNALLGAPDLLAEADQYSAEALAGIPWNQSLKNTRGVVLLAIGRLEEALPLLRAGVAVKQGNPDSIAQSQSMLAVGEAQAGNLAAAEQALQAACDVAPDCFLIPRAETAVLSMRRQVAAAKTSSHPVPGAD